MRSLLWECLKPVPVFGLIVQLIMSCPLKILSAVLNILKAVKEVNLTYITIVLTVYLTVILRTRVVYEMI